MFLLSSTIEHLLPLFLTMLKDEVKFRRTDNDNDNDNDMSSFKFLNES